MQDTTALSKWVGTSCTVELLLVALLVLQLGCVRVPRRGQNALSPDSAKTAIAQSPGYGMGGRPVPPPSLGPVSQEDFATEVAKGQVERIHIGLFMPDDSGAGSYGMTIAYREPRTAPFLTHFLDVTTLDYKDPGREVEYSFEARYRKEFIQLLDLIREKKLLESELARDPNGGPDRYALSVTIIGYPDVDNWCEKQKKPEPGYSVAAFQCPVVREKTSTFRTNTRVPLSKANADFIEIMDFIRQKLIQYALDNYTSLEEYRGAETVG